MTKAVFAASSVANNSLCLMAFSESASSRVSNSMPRLPVVFTPSVTSKSKIWKAFDF